MRHRRTSILGPRRSLIGLAALGVLLGACAPSPAMQLEPPTATPPHAAATATSPATEAAAATATETPSPLPLSEPGPYFAGRRTFSVADPDREGREVKIDVWYPAIRPEGYKGTVADDAPPDASGAPYPLILSSSKVARVLGPSLISHGFTWASVSGIDSYPQMRDQMFSQPLDILFALDQVASDPPGGLEGMIDAEHAGALGYSFDGYNTLAMSGARIDPEHYLAQCPNPDATTQAILSSLSAFNCGPAQDWDAFMARAGEALTANADGLWQPMTDARIRAVMPLAGEGWWLFGARGLAAVNRPVLIIAASEDPLYPENSLIFDHLGTPDKAFITFIGPGHMMVLDPPMVARMAHFATAFFGYHLQGKTDLGQYLSEDWVSQQAGLAWGVYPGE